MAWLVTMLPCVVCVMSKAHIELTEIHEAMKAGRLKADGKVLMADGQANVTKVSP